ncbi:2-oxo-4-hydroxy-4-carboxy-5-ureidoimidazoline decarboxylase [Halomicronema sp. CCY15110]|uniref:2-oxo-4-hydroxy-4-carboxy-5-ureidoimidazoline decarboxylase n=1 Tax=Halomicronema sp. CCY15110 TaxID=2767773 RepID=UPI001EF16522|nr:2-oxo-4-hydroxy-4-carboxy-5-ureidoimidazoline decarboxylase [Halomicronema sp. CCY15110]
MTPMTLAALNQMDQADFTQALGDIFEHTPAIAQQTWPRRPFATVESLHQAMVAVMQALPTAAQVRLIQAHPDLGVKAKMTAASVQEQAGAGLDQLSPEEFTTFSELNQAYRDRFQFPFIVAVKEHTKTSILAAFRQRLTHDAETERQTALAEIAKIAGYRLATLVLD